MKCSFAAPKSLRRREDVRSQLRQVFYFCKSKCQKLRHGRDGKKSNGRQVRRVQG